MNEQLELSAAGQNLIKSFESCLKPVGGGKYTAYRDPVGIPTIGWGHTNHHGRKFVMGDVWTKAEVDLEFQRDMALFEDAVQKLTRVVLQQYQFDALVSFTYNCGQGALARSTLLRKVNAQDWDGAAREFLRWTRAGGQVLRGLVRRRASESLLFQNIPDLNYDGRPDKVVKPPSPAEAEKVEPPVRNLDPPAPGEEAKIDIVTGGNVTVTVNGKLLE